MKLNEYFIKLSKRFNGAYGFDRLSTYLLAIGLLFLSSRWTLVFGVASIGTALWRSFSKDSQSRQRELFAFYNLLNTIKSTFNLQVNRVTQFKKYKVFTCANCSQKLRIPRGKGKVTITCKKCGTEFKGKS